MSEPGTISAATAAKAADDGSAGTRTARASSSGCPTTVMRRAPEPASLTVTRAPKCRSINSVWSRVASGSMTVVSPGAFNPASRIADLTWAEGTGSS